MLLNRVPTAEAAGRARGSRAGGASASLGYDRRRRRHALRARAVARLRALSSTGRRRRPTGGTCCARCGPETFFLWYRTSPQLLVPWGTGEPGRPREPAADHRRHDARRRRRERTAVRVHRRAEPAPSADAPAPPMTGSRSSTPPDCRSTASRQATPSSCRPFYADERRAWEGPAAGSARAHRSRRGGAARPASRCTSRIAGPWSRFGREVAPPPSLFTQIIGGLAAIIMPALMVARRRARARATSRPDRGDRAGAFRVGAFVFVVSLVAWVLGDIARRRRRHRGSAASSPRSAARSSMPACCG